MFCSTRSLRLVVLVAAAAARLHLTVYYMSKSVYISPRSINSA